MPLNRPDSLTASNFVDRREAERAQTFGQSRLKHPATGLNSDTVHVARERDNEHLDVANDDRKRRAVDLRFASRQQTTIPQRPAASLSAGHGEPEADRHEEKPRSRIDSTTRNGVLYNPDDTTTLSVFSKSSDGEAQVQDVRQVQFDLNETAQSGHDIRESLLHDDDEDLDPYEQETRSNTEYGINQENARGWSTGNMQDEFSKGRGLFGHQQQSSLAYEGDGLQSLEEVVDYGGQREQASTTPSRHQSFPPQPRHSAPKPPLPFLKAMTTPLGRSEPASPTDTVGILLDQQNHVAQKRKFQQSLLERIGPAIDQQEVPMNMKTTSVVTSTGSSISSVSGEEQPAQVDQAGSVGQELQGNPATDLDYDIEELGKMKYDDLDQVPFSQDPNESTDTANDDYGNPVPLTQKLGRLEHMSEDKQRLLFQTQTDDEWEKTGAWFVEMFANDLKKLMQARMDRRRTALKFELDAKKRQKEVETKTEDVQANLDSLKQGGNNLIKGREPSLPLQTPRKGNSG